MAFVILSAGSLTQSKMRTLSVRGVLGFILAILLVALAGGFALGYSVRPATPQTETVVIGTVSVDPQHPEGRLLIERVGELSGRMVQLEAEAADLAARIGAIKEFEARINEDLADAAKAGRAAKTPVATSTGGPLLEPVRLPKTKAPERHPPPADLPVEPLPETAPAGKADPLADGLSSVERDVERLARKFARLDRAATDYRLAQMSFPGRAPVVDVAVSSTFGNRIDPFRKRSAFHSGVDYPAPTGTPITASAGGRVIFAGYRAAYGKTVEIDHGAGLATRYAHASKLHVKVGQVVMPGQHIADVGSTGRSTGPHLHFEILQDDLVVDPATYLARF